jgi:hypothetical protein
VVAGLIALEKTLPWRRAATYGTAVVLLTLGVLVLAAPQALPGLTVPTPAGAATTPAPAGVAPSQRYWATRASGWLRSYRSSHLQKPLDRGSSRRARGDGGAHLRPGQQDSAPREATSRGAVMAPDGLAGAAEEGAFERAPLRAGAATQGSPQSARVPAADVSYDVSRRLHSG